MPHGVSRYTPVDFSLALWCCVFVTVFPQRLYLPGRFRTGSCVSSVSCPSSGSNLRPTPNGGGLDLKGDKKAPPAREVERGGAGGKPAEWVGGAPHGGKGICRVARSFKQPSAVHGEVGKSSTRWG